MATPLGAKSVIPPVAGDYNEEAIFQTFPRVLYQRNPLEFVVCEIRFPPILKLELELPVLFQDKVRAQYPLFHEITPINLSGQPPAEVARLLGSAVSIPMVKSYEFSSADEVWILSLSRSALSLTCRQYRRWEEFRERFEQSFKALLESYDIQFFVRIGLRYRDVISKEKLGLQDTPWSELLDPWIAGEFHSPFAPVVSLNRHSILLKLKVHEAQIQLQHGLQPSPSSNEVDYVFDTDFFTLARKEQKDVSDVLRFFNKYSWRVFRSCIREKLHKAMGPEPI